MTSSLPRGILFSLREFYLFIMAYSNTKFTVTETPAGVLCPCRSALALQQCSEPFRHREVTVPLICSLSVETSTIII